MYSYMLSLIGKIANPLTLREETDRTLNFNQSGASKHLVSCAGSRAFKRQKPSPVTHDRSIRLDRMAAHVS